MPNSEVRLSQNSNTGLTGIELLYNMQQLNVGSIPTSSTKKAMWCEHMLSDTRVTLKETWSHIGA